MTDLEENLWNVNLQKLMIMILGKDQKSKSIGSLYDDLHKRAPVWSREVAAGQMVWMGGRRCNRRA